MSCLTSNELRLHGTPCFFPARFRVNGTSDTMIAQNSRELVCSHPTSYTRCISSWQKLADHSDSIDAVRHVVENVDTVRRCVTSLYVGECGKKALRVKTLKTARDPEIIVPLHQVLGLSSYDRRDEGYDS